MCVQGIKLNKTCTQNGTLVMCVQGIKLNKTCTGNQNKTLVMCVQGIKLNKTCTQNNKAVHVLWIEKTNMFYFRPIAGIFYGGFDKHTMWHGLVAGGQNPYFNSCSSTEIQILIHCIHNSTKSLIFVRNWSTFKTVMFYVCNITNTQLFDSGIFFNWYTMGMTRF
jgi:hypothetical protein